MTKLLIDTDPGQDIDDLLAIHFALLRPELDVRAITTVTWPAERRERLVRRLLRHLGRGDIPVAAGMNYPLRPFTGPERTAQHDLSRSMNHESFALPEDRADAVEATDAVELIVRTVEQNPGQIVLACIAPLTNIATALCRRPEIAPQIKAILLMGGETALNRAEHNVAFDYVAADIVLSSGLPIVMGTWDVTRRVSLSMAEMDLFRRSASPVCQALARATEQWHPAQSWKPGPVLYDLFPIVQAFDESYYRTAEMRVQVQTSAGPACGMTIAGGTGTPVRVTRDVRAADVKKLYLETVLG